MEGKEVFWDLNERFGKGGRFEALRTFSRSRKKKRNGKRNFVLLKQNHDTFRISGCSSQRCSKFIYCHQTSKLNRGLFNELLDID